MENNKDFNKFIIFWFSQSVSQLGSKMTSYALILWAYHQTNSALSISLMSFCSYLPYIIISIFAGTFVDRHKKKNIMAVSDTIAAVCSLCIFTLLISNQLLIWHIYLVNIIVGFMDSFQSPATSIAVGILIPQGKYEKASGLDSFSRNLVTVSSPMLAAVILSTLGMGGVIVIDLTTFLFAMIVLVFFIPIKEERAISVKKKEPFLAGFHEGIDFLRKHKIIFYIMISMALINFFSRLTYENILSPMLISRSGGDDFAYGVVNAVLGIGGIVGGIIVSLGKMPKDKMKMIYFSAAFSFLVGDILMGVGRNVFVWSIASLAASVLIPFILAGQQVILYETVPRSMQGRIFSIRNTIQFSTVPIGILLGGILADYVFEPFMSSNNIVATLLGRLVGLGPGSGMAVMFLMTGLFGFISSLIGYSKCIKVDNWHKDK